MISYQGPLFRALNPVWARDPLSGRGAELHGGRFNAKGTGALYTALSIPTAIREVNQAGHLQPVTLVEYRAEIACVFDTRDLDALAELGMDRETLADPGWRQAMTTGVAPSQAAAAKIREAGFPAMLTTSFARGAGPDDLNLVLWVWNTEDVRLQVVHDENRLSRT